MIRYFGSRLADPVCSLFICALIVLSVIPLLQESTAILLQTLRADQRRKVDRAVGLVAALPCVVSYRGLRAWALGGSDGSGPDLHVSLHVQAEEAADEAVVLAAAQQRLREGGVNTAGVTVQVEKQRLMRHLGPAALDTLQYYNLARAVRPGVDTKLPPMG